MSMLYSSVYNGTSLRLQSSTDVLTVDSLLYDTRNLTLTARFVNTCIQDAHTDELTIYMWNPRDITVLGVRSAF